MCAAYVWLVCERLVRVTHCFHVIALRPQEAGHALAAVLFGDVNPSGKLPLSFPSSDTQSWLTSPRQYPGELQPGTAQPRYVATYSEGLEMGCVPLV